MQSAERVIEVESPIIPSGRVRQVEGMFDLPAAKVSKVSWTLEHFRLPDEWSIGLIVGPSGSGKSTLARREFGLSDSAAEWSDDRSILDGFPPAMPIQEV